MKKIVFILAFGLMNSLSFANNKEISSIVENETTSFVIDNLIILGVCNFSYTLTYTNSETGESFQRTFYRSTYASSQSDCASRAY